MKSERNAVYGELKAKGFRFFPLKSNSKAPASANGFHAANGHIPERGNIGVSPPLGSVVVDVDSEEALKLCRSVPDWNEATFTVRTPRGFHFYWLKATDIKQTAGGTVFGKHVDVRVGGKGYVVGPFSTVGNKPYVVINDTPPAEMPPSLLTLLQRERGEGLRTEASPNVKSLRRLGSYIYHGERNSKLTSLAGSLFASRASDASVWTALQAINQKFCEEPLPLSELSSIYHSIKKREARPADFVGASYVHFTEIGEDNVAECLRVLDIRLRFNTRAEAVELSEGGGVWKKLTDEREALILSDIERGCIHAPSLTKGKRLQAAKPIKFSLNDWRRWSLALACRAMVDPFQLWLEQLPAWDGTKRLATVLTDLYHTTTAPELVAWSVRSVLLAAVERTYRPGRKHDEVVVLIGPQGAGKSTFWNALLPSSDYFSDSLNLALDDKGRVESLLGKVVVESSEMRGSNRAEIESLKAFISRSVDYVRLAYARYPKDLPRRCVIVGSTNDKACLPNDHTGNRRFVPVELIPKYGDKQAMQVNAVVPAVRDQLWAEALVLYHQGKESWLTPDLSGVQREAAEHHRRGNEVLEERIDNFLMLDTSLRGFTMEELLHYTDSQSTMATMKEISGILRKNGYEKRRITLPEGRRLRWVKVVDELYS